MRDLQHTPTPAQAASHGRVSANSTWALARRVHTRWGTTRIVVAGVSLATVAILLWALLTPATPTAPSTAGATPGAAAPLVGHFAPDATLLTLSNQSVRLSSLRGSVVVLNFWYVACEPCRYEMPALEKSYLSQHTSGLQIVGVNTSDDSQSIAEFTRQIGISYPIWRDVGQRVVIDYRVTSTPTTFIIDRRGVIRAKKVGPVDSADLAQYVTPLLREQATAGRAAGGIAPTSR